HGNQRGVDARITPVLRRPVEADRRSCVPPDRGGRRAAADGRIGAVREDRPRGVMRLQRLGVSLFAAIALISVVLAAATIWLILTNPVTVANAVNEGDITPLIRDLADA